MNETYVTIRGRLTADPTVRTTRAGAPMTTFRIAHSARRQVQGQPGQWEDTEASFYDVVTYRSLAANIGVSLRKGHPITLHGKQRVTSWQREDGSTRNSVEIEADAVGHDLTFGTTAFARVGMGRAVEAWSPGEAPAPESGRQSGSEYPSRVGDPDSDPYVVDEGPGGGLGEVDFGETGDQGSTGDDLSDHTVDTGPLLPPGKEAAA